MGLRHTVQAYRCTDLDQFQQALAATAKKHGGTCSAKIQPKDDKATLRVGVGPNAIAIYYPREIPAFFRDLSFSLGGVPYLEARIQEGSHWDYSLYRGMRQLDQFSTFPQYWNDEADPIDLLYHQGRPEMLSLVFNVPQERFIQYLKHCYADWDEETEEYRFKLTGKAYPEDHSPYGDYEQMWDFLNSLGIHDPCGRIAPENRFDWELVLPETLG
jgi:hypothetical protein